MSSIRFGVALLLATALTVLLSIAACTPKAGVHRAAADAADWTVLLDPAQGIDRLHRLNAAHWRVENGALVADAKTGDSSGFLVTPDAYGDFILRVEFKVSEEANSGVYFRCDDGAKPTDTGCYEANIYDQRPDQTYATGSIVHVASAQPTPKAAGAWRTYDIEAQGSHLRVKLDGRITAETNDARHVRGPIAFQYAAGTVQFRRIAIRPAHP